MPIVVVPISLLTFGKVIHFAYLNKNLKESAPYILLQFNTSFVWICYGLSWLYHESFKANTHTLGEWILYKLLGLAYELDVVGIFVYTWTLLEMGITDHDTNCKKAIILYRNISILIFPLISYALYIGVSFAAAKNDYDEQFGAKPSLSKERVLALCLLFWNGLLVLLSCLHLAFFLG